MNIGRYIKFLIPFSFICHRIISVFSLGDGVLFSRYTSIGISRDVDSRLVFVT